MPHIENIITYTGQYFNFDKMKNNNELKKRVGRNHRALQPYVVKEDNNINSIEDTDSLLRIEQYKIFHNIVIQLNVK